MHVVSVQLCLILLSLVFIWIHLAERGGGAASPQLTNMLRCSVQQPDSSGTPVISVVETLVTPAAISTSVGDSRDDETPENGACNVCKDSGC